MFRDDELTAMVGATDDEALAAALVDQLAAEGIASRLVVASGDEVVGQPIDVLADPAEDVELQLFVHPDDRELVMRTIILPGLVLPPEMRDDHPEIAAWLAERAEREAAAEAAKVSNRATARAMAIGLLVPAAGLVALKGLLVVLDLLTRRT